MNKLSGLRNFVTLLLAVGVAGQISLARAEVEAPMDAKLVVDTGAPLSLDAKPNMSSTDSSTSPQNQDAKAIENRAETRAETRTETRAEINKLPENQIPVLSGTKDIKKASTTDYRRILITLAVFTVLFAGLGFGLRRWMSRKSPASQNTKIRVLTQHALGPKKSLAIIQVAGEAILIGITDQNISMLKTLALIDDEVPEQTPSRFEAALSDFDDAEIGQLALRAGRRGRADAEPEEFAMRGLGEIRDTVSTHLRGLKKF